MKAVVEASYCCGPMHEWLDEATDGVVLTHPLKVRAIAEAHGGEVNAESAPGSGSTFTVLLPCHAPGMQAEAMGRAPLRGH